MGSVWGWGWRQAGLWGTQLQGGAQAHPVPTLSATHPGRPEGRPRPPSGSQTPPQVEGMRLLPLETTKAAGRTQVPATEEHGCTCYPRCPQKESEGPGRPPAACRTCTTPRPLRGILAQGGPPGRPVSRQTRKVWVGTATEQPSPSLLRGQMEEPVLRPHSRSHTMDARLWWKETGPPSPTCGHTLLRGGLESRPPLSTREGSGSERGSH